MKHVKGKHCLVTGASKGLGKDVAVLLVQAGANVTICARGKVVFTPTAEQIADGMTKALPREGVRKLRDGIGLKQRNTLNKTVTRNAFVAKSGGPLSALSDLTASTSGRRKQRCVCLETKVCLFGNKHKQLTNKVNLDLCIQKILRADKGL
jgi:NAD(P)-dependent dehydrogenase (short-subunit alcohol dehydrogenase family)